MGHNSPPTPTLPHKGGGSLFLPPPLWGRVGVGENASPSPRGGEGWGGGECFSLPPCGGGLGWGELCPLPPLWGRVGVGENASPSPPCGGGVGWGELCPLPPCGGGLGWGRKEKNVQSPRAQYSCGAFPSPHKGGRRVASGSAGS